MASREIKQIDYPLHDRQLEVLDSDANMVLYGGQAGGGKSHLARVLSISAATEVPGLVIMLVRQRYGDLMKNHFVGPTSFGVLLGDMIAAGFCKIDKTEISFANGPNGRKPFDGGSKIIGVQCLIDKDLGKVHGAEPHMVLFEESTMLLQHHIEYILGRMRVPEALPVKGTSWEGRLPFSLFTTNPVGASLTWHIRQFIEGRNPGEKWEETKIVVDGQGNEIPVRNVKQFIPASLDDNPSIDKAQYVGSLSHLSPELQDALLRGRWDVQFGNFYPELSKPVHTREHFDPPSHWPKFVTHDWGSNAPAATIWWAVADGETGDMPRGSLYAYREWYCAEPDDTTKGLRLSNVELAQGIVDRSAYGEHTLVWTDSLPFQDRGGKPMWLEYEECGVYLKQAKMAKKKISAAMVRTRLIGKAGKPTMYFSDRCTDTFRTLAMLGHHASDPEKPDGEEDHLPDCVMHAARMWAEAQDSAESERAKLARELRNPPPKTLASMNLKGLQWMH